MSIKNNKNAVSDTTAHFLCGKRLLQFTALQHALVPRSMRFTDQERQRSESLVNNLLSQQNKASQMKLIVFLNVIDLFSFICHGKTFRLLETDKQKQILTVFFNSPVSLFRKGFWGLNTLARLGVYGQKELHNEIGYNVRPYPNDKLVKEQA
jgi:hypothetical protein